MQRARKITGKTPPELLDKAQRVSGLGISQTVRTGLQLVAASGNLRQAFTIAWQGSFHPYIARLKSRSIIVADTSTWIGFLQGENWRGC